MPMNNKPRNQRRSALNMMASRLANLAIPSSANSIFSKIQEVHAKRYGMGSSMGMATDPRQWFMSNNPFTEQISIGLGSTMSLRDAQNRIERETRTELANRSGVSLPQYMAPLKKGIATADQHRFCDHEHGVELNQESLSNIQEQRTISNNRYVQDQRWPVTLNQILGSKMLTPQQLKAASIQNIGNYLSVQGGTAEEKAEMHYMFQRMMLEGFIRGVDITKDFKGNGGRNGKLNINLIGGSTVKSNANNIGLSTQTGTVKFNVDYMRRNDDNVKLSLFYHEIGHELLNKEHASAEGIMKSGGSNRAGKNLLKSEASYNAIMNQLFTTNGQLSNGAKHLKIPVNRGIEAQYDPSWYPSATGQGTGYDPGSSDPSSPQGQTYIQAPDVTVNQTTINPFQPKGAGSSNPGTIDTSGSGRPNTMQVPELNIPQMTGVNLSQGFAQGVQSVQQEQQPLQGNGDLTQLRAG